MSRAAELRIGGLTRLSTCDWPGELVATLFCQGCPWTCRYCHNPHLIPGGGPGAVPWEEVSAFLRTRRGLLDGVVFSGGEPTVQAGLADAVRAVRDLGFRVGLHTAGPYPERLAAVLPLLDWVGFDVKAPFDAYPRITGVPGSGVRARDSLERVLASGVALEVRTTVHPALLDAAALSGLAAELLALGVRRYAVQAFRALGCADADLVAAPVPPALDVLAAVAARFPDGIVRAS